MKVKLDKGGLEQSKWNEYLVRFMFGGAVTALTGIVAKRFGPEIGGLFLSFPAIFPAAATLIDQHEKRKEQNGAEKSAKRDRVAAGLDATGAAMGSIGLLLFAFVVWQRIRNSTTGIVPVGATLA